jgi:hypothetical protein
MTYLIITTIADLSKLEDTLKAITSSGVSGSTVLSGNVYVKPGKHPHLSDEFDIAALPDELFDFDKRDGKAILSIASSEEQVEKVKKALELLYSEGGKHKKYGYSLIVLPVDRVAGLLEINDSEDKSGVE